MQKKYKFNDLQECVFALADGGINHFLSYMVKFSCEEIVQWDEEMILKQACYNYYEFGRFVQEGSDLEAFFQGLIDVLYIEAVLLCTKKLYRPEVAAEIPDVRVENKKVIIEGRENPSFRELIRKIKDENFPLFLLLKLE
jgi:hypothetical protein